MRLADSYQSQRLDVSLPYFVPWNVKSCVGPMSHVSARDVPAQSCATLARISRGRVSKWRIG